MVCSKGLNTIANASGANVSGKEELYEDGANGSSTHEMSSSLPLFVLGLCNRKQSAKVQNAVHTHDEER